MTLQMTILALAWYAFLGVIIYYFQKTTRFLTNWNTFTLFLVTVLLFHGVYVPFSLGINLDSGHIVDSVDLVIFIMNLIVMYIFLILGAVTVRSIFPLTSFVENRVVPRLGVNPIFFWSAFVVAVGLLLYKLSMADIRLGLMSFFLKDASGNFSDARHVFGQSTASGNSLLLYLANISDFAFLPLMLFVLYFAKHAKKKRIFTLLFWGLCVLVFYQSIISGHKAAPVMILIGLFICRFLRTGGFEIRGSFLKIALLSTAVLVVIMPFLYQAQYKDLSYFEALHSVWYRIAIEPNRVLQLYFSTYPEKHDFMLGTSSQMIAALTGVSAIPPHSYIPRAIFGQFRTTWNAIFIADAWADLAYFGTIFSSFFVGILLQFYNSWFARTEKTCLAMGTYVALIISTSKLAAAGLFSSLLTFGVLSTFFCYLIVKELPWIKSLNTVANNSASIQE